MWSEDEVQAQGSELKISEFFRLKWYLSGQNTTGHQNSFLVPLKNGHLEVLRYYTKYRRGPGNLHIIIHGRNQKLSIPRPNPYKQCAETIRQLPLELRAQRVQFERGIRRVQFVATISQRQPFFFRQSPEETEILNGQTEALNAAKRLCESSWFDQNQQLNIETLWIQIVLSIKAEKKKLLKVNKDH